ncbi:MAG: hypothetical protein O7A06_09280, partial [Acidobacteria bacterium]|nr:hypothetical protein [Acidobacteriota bacterium]
LVFQIPNEGLGTGTNSSDRNGNPEKAAPVPICKDLVPSAASLKEVWNSMETASADRTRGILLESSGTISADDYKKTKSHPSSVDSRGCSLDKYRGRC